MNLRQYFIITSLLLCFSFCGPKFESIEVRYEIPYGSKYYRIDGQALKAEKKSGKTPGIAVSESRFLQTTGSSNPGENEHAITMALAGKWQKAAAKWGQLSAKNPSDLAALNNRGVALTVLGRHADASELFAKCMQQDDAEVYIFHYQASINLDARYTPVVKPASFADDKSKKTDGTSR